MRQERLCDLCVPSEVLTRRAACELMEVAIGMGLIVITRPGRIASPGSPLLLEHGVKGSKPHHPLQHLWREAGIISDVTFESADAQTTPLKRPRPSRHEPVGRPPRHMPNGDVSEDG